MSVKVEFPLEIEDGFPPVSVETLNAEQVEGGLFKLLNTPFFAKNVAYGDCLEASYDSRGLVYVRNVEHSGFRAVSIILFTAELDEAVMDLLRGVGCVLEYGEFGAMRMVAVGVPPAADYPAIRRVLDHYEAREMISYAELVA